MSPRRRIGHLAASPLGHGFVVASHGARFLTLHTPAGFDRVVSEAGTRAEVSSAEREIHVPDCVHLPSPEELTRIAAKYGIEIVGPPPPISA